MIPVLDDPVDPFPSPAGLPDVRVFHGLPFHSGFFKRFSAFSGPLRDGVYKAPKTFATSSTSGRRLLRMTVRRYKSSPWPERTM
jgi:hypothetical protein